MLTYIIIISRTQHRMLHFKVSSQRLLNTYFIVIPFDVTYRNYIMDSSFQGSQSQEHLQSKYAVRKPAPFDSVRSYKTDLFLNIVIRKNCRKTGCCMYHVTALRLLRIFDKKFRSILLNVRSAL
jgi:hypothetical protein